jgi:hypothetical protein
MTSLTSVDKILDSFPIQNVPPIIGEPTFESINNLHRVLKTNAASVPTALGGGVLGHLTLVLPAAEYANLSATAFPAPNNPGATIVPVAGATAAQLATAYPRNMRTLYRHSHSWKTYWTTRTLRNRSATS